MPNTRTSPSQSNSFFQQDILSADQFTKENLALLVDATRKMEKIVAKDGATDILKGKLMTALFYEPSSRTFASLIAAMQRLGGGFLPFHGMTHSSVAKGEIFTDTIQTFCSYSDLIVIRNPEVGSAKAAAEVCDVPVINAGDGIGEHPTQAALDFYTITNHFGMPEGITVTMVGDLLNGRTIHSLSKLLSLYAPLTLNLVSPEMLKMPSELVQFLRQRGVDVHEYTTLEEVLPTTDVLYVTRVQKERFSDLELYEKLKHHYIITPTLLKPAKKTTIIMHPLPRVGEITLDVDADPRAVYIREQMRNGMFVRMALLALVLRKKGV